MLDPRTLRFWQVACQSKLVDEDQLRTCWDQVPVEKRTEDAGDRRLARRVVDAGLMTRWQAQQLLLGMKPHLLWYDRYVVLDLLGQGGMGRVYLARDGRLDRKVALKVMSRERVSNPRAMLRFRREGKVGAQLEHEHLVRIYDEGEANGYLYLVLEFVDGKSVSQLLAQRGPIPPSVAARLAAEVAEALEHVHEQGLVHRDVNPMNILIDRRGRAKLTDLGLAISLESQGEPVTRDGATVGTFDYISPEQARHSRAIDIRSDIYSLGCTLYHMLAGRVPFPQPSLPEKLYSHQLVTPEPLADLVSDLPAGLDAVVHRMMAKAPEARFATPSEVVGALVPYECGPITLEEIELRPEKPIWIDPVASGEHQLAADVAPTKVVASDAPGPWDSEPAREPVSHTAGLATQTPNADVAPDPMSLLDFGPSPSLGSNPTSTSGSRSRTGSGDQMPSYGRWPRQRVALLAAPAIVVGLALLALWAGRGEGTPEPRPRVEPVNPTPAQTEAHVPEGVALAVRWSEDSSIQPVETLEEAVRISSGKPAQILIGGGEPLVISDESPLLVSDEGIHLRGMKGGTSRVILRRTKPRSVIRVNPTGTLRLSGLTLSCEDVSDGSASGTTEPWVEVFGDIRMEHCRIGRSGAPGGALQEWISLQGRLATFDGCVIGGFGSPFRILASNSCRVEMSRCLVDARTQRGTTSASQPLGGWCIWVQAIPVGTSQLPSRVVRIERSTFLGDGFLRLEDLSPDRPLKVELAGAAVSAQQFVGWRGSHAFPQGLVWNGKGDVYEVSPGPWVVTAGGDGDAFEPLASGPPNLGGWTSGKLAEADSREMRLDLPSEPWTEAEAADDLARFAPQAIRSLEAGVDPAMVGPQAAAGAGRTD
jgi:serine/threonine protein kinase